VAASTSVNRGTRKFRSVEVMVLGPFRCIVDGTTPPKIPRMSCRIGTVLAGWPGLPIDRDRLIHAMWDGAAPVDAVNCLQGHVSALRRSLGSDTIITDGDAYALDIPASNVDAEVFASIADSGRELMQIGDAKGALGCFNRARELWHGVPYRDVFDTDLIGRRERLAETYEQVRELALSCMLMLATTPVAAAEVVPLAKEEVVRAPRREVRHALLVQALMAANRPVEALHAYRIAEEYLTKHCGAGAGPQLQALRPSDDARRFAGPLAHLLAAN
jgi:DNA-binding SARP family transcriptional activator